MTRFILSWLMVLGWVVGLTSVHAAQNSKRPAALPPTLLGRTSSVVAAVATVAKATGSIVSQEVVKAEAKAKTLASTSGKALGTGLARVTAYWSGEGDYYTRHHISSTGIILHNGHCAVDPTIIPYGSVVQIDGLGTYLAVDTGTAVVSRRAARESGHNRTERHALVVDLYFESRSDGEHFAATAPKFASITWSSPGTDSVADASSTRTLVALNDTSRNRAL
jgi:3D (Asp-Asp-Asp) domain-containing protein